MTTWANVSKTCELLGITGAALLLLQRDRVLPPDCAGCGRIRWDVEELTARRDEVREYLMQRYGGLDMQMQDLISQ